MVDPATPLKQWLVRKAFELACEDVRKQNKYDEESIAKLGQMRLELNTTEYMVGALIEYLEEKNAREPF